MPSHLSHSLLVEEPGQDATPAAEDDIEAVKTLCGMGFSRTQAVTALEQHDYDVQRALNSLLGKPSTLCHGVRRDTDSLLRHPINRFCMNQMSAMLLLYGLYALIGFLSRMVFTP
jgi:hypothetical protein